MKIGLEHERKGGKPQKTGEKIKPCNFAEFFKLRKSAKTSLKSYTSPRDVLNCVVQTIFRVYGMTQDK
jgi:hypothetical protein